MQLVQFTEFVHVLQLFSQFLQSPDAPYCPIGQTVTHKLLLRNVPNTHDKQVSVVFIQVLHGKTQVWHCIIVSFGI
jgi:hypothetical protein